MAFVACQGVWMPERPLLFAQNPPTNADSTVVDATGEKLAFIGRVWNKDRATKDIRHVGFQFGTVTKAGGSALTISLQNVDLANGPPGRPDEAQDQTVAIANGDAAFAPSTWYRTSAFSADRTVAFGELLAVVIEFDGSGRLGADTFSLRSISGVSSNHQFHEGYLVHLTGGTWTAQSMMPNIALEFSDGTFGTLEGSTILTAAQVITTYNSGSTPDERALQFTVPFACKIDAIHVLVNLGSTAATCDLVLYEGTSALQTVSFDPLHVLVTSATRPLIATIPETELEPGTTYYIAVKPTSANAVTFANVDVNDANHFQAWPGGTSWCSASRVDAGAWTTLATRRMMAGIRISALADSATGSSPILRPGLHAIDRGLA
jgi:hypothetical protein